MPENWKNLNNPPVIVAIFQVKLEHEKEFDFLEYTMNDKQIRARYPKRNDGYHSNIDVPGTPTPGVSFIKAKADTRIQRFTYATSDLKQKIDIEINSITFSSEGDYKGWETFKKNCIEALNFFGQQLSKCRVMRTSIRFVNKFQFDEFNDPLEYFNTTISSDSDSKLQFPVTGFSYKIVQHVPETLLRVILNHALEKIKEAFDYYLDIDVLDDESFDYDLKVIEDKLENLREFKNTIFFETLKDKTLELCN